MSRPVSKGGACVLVGLLLAVLGTGVALLRKAEAGPTRPTYADTVANSLDFGRNDKTGDCFAVTGENGPNIAWVPCSPAVMRLVGAGRVRR